MLSVNITMRYFWLISITLCYVWVSEYLIVLYNVCVNCNIIPAVCYGKRFGPKGYGYGQGGGALQSDIAYANGYVA